MRSYPVKDNPIGSTVSEILRYRQTHRQTHILLLYYKDKDNPYDKVTEYLSVCLFVQKDLANRWIDMALHYRVASHRSWESLYIFSLRIITTLPIEIAPKKK